MDILAQIRQDYQRFPKDQSFDLYAEDVFFQDPLNQFRGIRKYQEMIGFFERWFLDIDLDLHQIQRTAPDRIETEWTLSWTAPLPWKPRLSIPGRSELRLNEAGKICAHVDYWHCSRWAVVRQVIPSFTKTSK